MFSPAIQSSDKVSFRSKLDAVSPSIIEMINSTYLMFFAPMVLLFCAFQVSS